MIEKKAAAGKPADDFIRIQDLWGLFVPKWHWFVLSLFVTMSVAVLRLMSTPSIYTRSAAILVKDDSNSGSSGGAMSEFSDMGIFRSNTNINNELFTLKSPALMTEVVRRLRLNETYTVRKGLKNVGLYKANPVAVTFGEVMEKPVSFTIRIDSKDAFTISGLKVAGVESENTFAGRMGDSIQTVAGTLFISPTKFYSDACIGTSIRYAIGKADGAADRYLNALRVELGSKEATIINLSINDTSIARAEDILNTLIEVYNEKWIQDKNQIECNRKRVGTCGREYFQLQKRTLVTRCSGGIQPLHGSVGREQKRTAYAEHPAFHRSVYSERTERKESESAVAYQFGHRQFQY